MVQSTVNRIRKEKKNVTLRNPVGYSLVVNKMTNAIIHLKLQQCTLRPYSDAPRILRAIGDNISEWSVRRLLRKLNFNSGI